MILTPVTFAPADLGIGVSGSERAVGLHMSDIYSALYQELEPKRFSKDSPINPCYLEMGLVWETVLEEGLKRKFLNTERPGEFCIEVDGTPIYYNPDLLIFNGETRVGEIKLTWMSSRDTPTIAGDLFPPKFDKYFCQMKAYCHAIGTPYARLYVFWVNGDYKPPVPQFDRYWDITFTPHELHENWDMLMNFAREKGML